MIVAVVLFDGHPGNRTYDLLSIGTMTKSQNVSRFVLHNDRCSRIIALPMPIR